MLFLTLTGMAALCLVIPGLWPVALLCVLGLFVLNAALASMLLVGVVGVGLYLKYST